MKTIIPFEINHVPVKKLAIINFEKNPDKVYRGFELQYLDGERYGKGYRIIAYRIDEYVDVYDDKSLNEIKNEKFDVAGKGICEHIRTDIHNVVIHAEDKKVNISFEFNDKSDRKVQIFIKEQSDKNTKGIDLLAPVGESSSNPGYFPVFFLYDFDFIRKAKTIIEIMIDNNEIKIDNFPFPMPKDNQLRYYSRYSYDCMLVEFANEKEGVIEIVEIDDDGILKHKDSIIRFDDNKMASITLPNTKHGFIVDFLPPFPDLLSIQEGKSFSGKISFKDNNRMGKLAGNYNLKRTCDAIFIVIDLSDGWIPCNGSFLTKILFGKKSVFRNWPKTYLYSQRIDIKTFETKPKWERISKR